MSVHFVFEDCIARDPGFEVFVSNARNRFQIPCTRVDIRPFSHEFIPNIWAEGKLMSREGLKFTFFGSTELIKIVHDRYSRGVFFNDNFRFTRVAQHYQHEMLNRNYTLALLGELTRPEHPIFVRPDEDLKLFSGRVVEPDEFDEWKSEILGVDNGPTLETPVIMANPQYIGVEYRFFVIGRRVVTGSRYKLNGRLALEPVIQYSDVWLYAQGMVNQWGPHDNFVIDIAHIPNTPDEFKVIEINCLNSAGIYACDTNQIVGKLLEWLEQN